MPNLLDAIGELERVRFEELYVDGIGSIQTFEADIQVEADGDSYYFRPLKIYTHQTGPDGDGFFPAKLDTSAQISAALELRACIDISPKAQEYLCELADAEGLQVHLMEAA